MPQDLAPPSLPQPAPAALEGPGWSHEAHFPALRSWDRLGFLRSPAGSPEAAVTGPNPST